MKNKSLLVAIVGIVGFLLLTSVSFAGTIIDQYKTIRGNIATVENLDIHKNRIGITINGQNIRKDTVYFNNTTYAPLRDVSDMLGATVNYNSKTMSADITINATIPTSLEGVWEGYYDDGRRYGQITFTSETATFKSRPKDSSNFDLESEKNIKYNSKTGFFKLESIKFKDGYSGILYDFYGSASNTEIQGIVLSGDSLISEFAFEKVK